MKKQTVIRTPLDDEQVGSLHAGDEVLITGAVLTARDQAHKRLCACIAEGRPMPVDLAGALVYFVGPTPAAPGRVIGAAGPTTSSRMDAFTPILLKAGLKGTIGKGLRSQGVREALIRYKGVHFSALGGGGAILSRHIVDSQLLAYDDLGAEAIRLLQFSGFPAIVAYDCHGNSIYNESRITLSGESI